MFGKSGKFFGLRGEALQIAIAVVAGCDFLLFGYDQGVTGNLLTLESFRRRFPAIDSQAAGISAAESSSRSTTQGIAVASYTLGCFFGAIACIWVGNALGRRWTIFVGTAIMVVGAILQTASFGLAQFIIGRVITGMGNGLNTSTIPTYQSECSKSHRRGRMVMIEGALITAGIALSYWVDFGFYFLDPSDIAWRFPIAIQLIFCLFILCFILSLPESPRWLLYKGREHDAMMVLAALRGTDENDDGVQTEFHEIKDTVIEASQGSFRDLFTMGKERNFHRVALAYINQVFQQISGINLITYYIPTVLENQIGLSPFLSKLIAACNGTEYFLASWIAVFTVEKFGRRKLMLFGAVGMAICMTCLAITGSFGTSGPGIAEVVFLFLFNTCFAIGWLGMTWLYPAEIVGLKIRAPANAVATSGNWLFNFLIVLITPISFANIGYQTYIIFAVINAFIVPVVYFFYPETAYRSLEEMDSIFANTTSIFDAVRVANNEPRRYGKNGETLINYEETTMARRRRSSTAVGSVSAHKHEKQNEEVETA